MLVGFAHNIKICRGMFDLDQLRCRHGFVETDNLHSRCCSPEVCEILPLVFEKC